MKRLNPVFFFLLLVTIGAALPHAVSAQNKDNLGKEFYLAFGPNLGSGEDSNLFALYITGPVASIGTVEVKALNFSKSFTTTPGKITTIELPNGGGGNGNGPSVECILSEEVLTGKAVHVVADTEVAVFGMNHKLFSSDAFMGLPIDVLGTEYRTMCYQTCQPNSNSETPGQFWMVALRDATNVTITPRARTANGKPPNTAFSVLLNQGDVYLVKGDVNDGSNDLTGSLIESDLPLAVFSGHERAAIPFDALNLPSGPNQHPSRDHLVEQLPPVSAWGDSALVIPYFSADLPDLVRIVSAEDGNEISVNGVVVATKNAGQFHEITKLPGPISVHGTKPILVGQYMHTSLWGIDPSGNDPDPYGDPALALVYPVEQFTKGYTFISVVNPTAFTGNFVNVVTPKTGVLSMILDGKSIPASLFSPITGSSYMYAQIRIDTQGTHNIRGAEPFGITVYALGNVDSYAYTGGTLLKTITPFKTKEKIVDFGDRLLDQATLAGSWDTTVELISESPDSLTISSYSTRGFNDTNFWVNPLRSARMMPAFATDSMTITFDPKKIANKRMHTTINAKTEHLRAFVVEVYGRGVLGKPDSYSDSSVTNRIDTIWFGVHGENSPPVDTVCYIGNTGTGALKIHSMTITGADIADFTITKTLSQPVWVDTMPSVPAGIPLRFKPSLPRAGREAFLDINVGDIFPRRVVLLAKVDSIETASIATTPFDSIYICNTDEKIIVVTNKNTFTVRMDSLVLNGADPNDFIILDQAPIDLPPQSVTNVRLRFVPNAPGYRTATATANFNNPMGSSQTVMLEGFSKQPTPSFTSPQNIHILAGEEVQYPIYALSELSQFKSNTYTLEITYDPANITDIDLSQDGTLSQYGSYLVTSDNPGHSIYTVYTGDGSNWTGGGPSEKMPLISIHFSSRLSDGQNRTDFSKAITINYRVAFPNSPIPAKCLIQSVLPGLITLDSTCALVRVVKGLINPTEVAVYHPNPNPATSIAHVEIYIPSETQVTLDVVNIFGAVALRLLDEPRKTGVYEVIFDASSLPSGAYTVRLEAAGKVKLRKLLISH